jgi:O-antigen ligase/tetratricopeptide (TPR) repeat protein
MAFPLAPQLEPYAPASAFVGLTLILLVVFSLVAAPKNVSLFASSFGWASVLWCGVWLCALVRSPNPGAGVPKTADAFCCLLSVAAGFSLAFGRPAFRVTVLRLIAAVAVVLACVGLVQYWVDLPFLRGELAGERLPVTPVFYGSAGLSRVFSNEIFGTFTNANAYGIYLAMGALILFGTYGFNRRAPSVGAEKSPPAKRFAAGAFFVCFVPLALALFLSNAKGAWVVLPLGFWFYLIRGRPSIFFWLTLAGVAVMVAALACGTAGFLGEKPFGESMRVRTEYWRTAGQALAAAPLLGHGAGSFSDVFHIFQTPSSEWTATAHNDWLEFWVELGFLGPLVYALLWVLLSAASRRTDPATEKTTRIAEGDSGTGRWAVAGAVFAMLVFILAFDGLNGDKLWAVVLGAARDASGESRRLLLFGAAAAVFYPGLFLTAYWLLGRLRPERILTRNDNQRRLSATVRAACGMVMIHQLVDYDFQSRGVIFTAFFIAGAFSAPPTVSPVLPTETLRRKFFWIHGAVCAVTLLLAPVLVVSPLLSGLARQAAETVEAEKWSVGFPSATDRPDKHESVSPANLRHEAFRRAPWDGQAALDWARALNAAGRHDDAENALMIAGELRPLFPGIWLEKSRNAFLRGDFQDAESFARRAAALAPMNPRLRMEVGDILLLAGRSAAQVTAEYQAAWETDRRIVDANKRLISCLLDSGYQGSGREVEIVARLEAVDSSLRETTDLDQTRLHAVEIAKAATLRIITARAALWRETLGFRPSHWARAEAGERTHASQRAALRRLLDACRLLVRLSPDDGRAALFAAAAFCVLPTDDCPSEWREEGRLFWREAQRLQAESLKRRNPDTAPLVFAFVARRLAEKTR